jgi:ABC-2 type transport system ATP-binding protein
MDAITTEGLTKRFVRFHFKRRQEVLALDHLDLRVEKGAVFGILGPNGSGKSTTMKLILGLIRPTAGRAFIFGKPCDKIESRLHVGFLPENPYFYPFLSGEETLWFYGKISGLSKTDLVRRVPELLDLVGLTEAKDRALAGYSKGMLQRIGLAQALVHDPELLLLDEPTAGVDPIGSREIRDLILHLKSRGKTVLLSSHLLEQVQDVCDRVCILHRGRKVLDGKLAEMISDQDRLNVVIEGWPDASHQELRAFIEQRGGRVVSLGHPQTTLESLFLNTVKDREMSAVSNPTSETKK